MFIQGKDGIASLSNVRSVELEESGTRIKILYQPEMTSNAFSYGAGRDAVWLRFESKEAQLEAFEQVQQHFNNQLLKKKVPA